VLATLWPVSDEASARFLDAFYQNLNESASVAAALRRTQIAHRHQNPSPFHWGFFTLIGLA
jgi:CHAT domain-containing protein